MTTHRIGRLDASALLARQPAVLFIVVAGLWMGTGLQGAAFAQQDANPRPNIVWILSEDNSKHYLELFDPNGAPTPNIEKLAERGVVFNHAFSNSPVCSVARTTLMTGLYAPRIAGQHHRRSKQVTLPEDWRLFPYYLRQAGYHTTNNRKKDYNVAEGRGVWDASSGQATWRDRPSADTPFFHMRTFNESHEGRLHFGRQRMQPDNRTTNPSDVALFPYFPDTEVFRYTMARYLDLMGTIDDLVGALVAELEADGLLDDTFIFYFGDHGGVLPRSKGYLYETGLHVPLVVYVPRNWEHVAGLQPAQRVNGFVSFVDFGPTVLHLAGVEVPAHMDGVPFLGRGVMPDNIEARNTTLGYADRFDERYDMVRSLRRGNYKYIRNYHAYYPDALRNNYRYQMFAYRQWLAMYQAGELDEIQRAFFEPRQAEALYDLANDPHEVNNLANDPEHARTLVSMRRELQEKLRGMPDLGFFPEGVLVAEAVDAPVAFGNAQRQRLERLMATADLTLLPFEQAGPMLETALADEDPWVRYWAVVACAHFGNEAMSLVPQIRQRLEDEVRYVRIRAMETLGLLKLIDPIPLLAAEIAASRVETETLLALNVLVFLRDHCGYEVNQSMLEPGVVNGWINRRVNYLGGSE